MVPQRREFLRAAGYAIAGAGVYAPPAYAKVAPAGSPSSGRSYDVGAFGAIGDGKAVDTPAVNRAIEAASRAGGGTVYFPAGTYACYSIHLASNVALYIDHGATIVAAATSMEGVISGGYDLAEPNTPWEDYQDFGHNHWHNSLLWGEGIHDVSIVGPGLIWGRGLSNGRPKQRNTDTPQAETPGVGNKTIALKNCRNVIIRDCSILQGGHFGILATGVDNLTIDNVKIDTNRDGIDIDCCRNVRISNCSVNSPWDDGICPKSSFALGYSRPTENVTISNCYVTGAFEMGTLLDGTFKSFSPGLKVPQNGRIKCGTESAGGFRNITISNCVFDGCKGLALESTDGAILEDISVTNITMRNIVDAVMFLRLGSRLRGPEGTKVGSVRRILISNIICSNANSQQGAILTGIPDHYIEDVKISDIFIQHQGGGSQEQGAINLPELEKEYPDPKVFGPTPTQGFFLRHIRNLEMSHIEIASIRPDQRPSFVLDDVQGAEFLRIRAPQGGGAPVFSLHNVNQFSVNLSRDIPDTTKQHIGAVIRI
jgi:polygalacturonase